MLEFASLTNLAAKLGSGETTSRELCELYLERIRRYDPALKSVLELNPAALETADQLDEERAEGKSRSKLHGLPILVKDNIDTADMPTTAGSLALRDYMPPRDAFLVTRLREAGALILGKTNLSEWANFRSSYSSSGLSSLGGQTRNPYDLTRSPCGSSSGSGAATAAGFCAASLGTETDGSIVCPSALCGVVGLKPTLGLLSRSGIIPVAHSQDTAGPMTHSVADAALLLNSLIGHDSKDTVTKAAENYANIDYSAYLKPDALEGARLGMVRTLTGYNELLDEHFEEQLGTLRKLGAEIIDVEIDSSALREPEYTVLLYEFKHDLNAYLASLPAGYLGSLRELIDFNETNREAVMPTYGQGHFERAQAKGPLSDKAYQQALHDSKRLSGPEGIDKALSEHTLDALVAPTCAPAWKIDAINGDNYRGSASTLAAAAGYPHLTVPMGQVYGLPVGMSFFGAAFTEAKLLAYGYAFEQTAGGFKAPDLASLRTGEQQR